MKKSLKFALPAALLLALAGFFNTGCGNLPSIPGVNDSQPAITDTTAELKTNSFWAVNYAISNGKIVNIEEVDTMSGKVLRRGTVKNWLAVGTSSLEFTFAHRSGSMSIKAQAIGIGKNIFTSQKDDFVLEGGGQNGVPFTILLTEDNTRLLFKIAEDDKVKPTKPNGRKVTPSPVKEEPAG